MFRKNAGYPKAPKTAAARRKRRLTIRGVQR